MVVIDGNLQRCHGNDIFGLTTQFLISGGWPRSITTHNQRVRHVLSCGKSQSGRWRMSFDNAKIDFSSNYDGRRVLRRMISYHVMRVSTFTWEFCCCRMGLGCTTGRRLLPVAMLPTAKATRSKVSTSYNNEVTVFIRNQCWTSYGLAWTLPS